MRICIFQLQINTFISSKHVWFNKLHLVNHCLHYHRWNLEGNVLDAKIGNQIGNLCEVSVYEACAVRGKMLFLSKESSGLVESIAGYNGFCFLSERAV